MSVEFNNESHEQRAALIYSQLQSTAPVSGMEKWLLDKGIVRSPEQAKAILVGTVVVCLVITIYVVYKAFAPKKVYVSPEMQKIIDYNANAGATI